MEPPPISASRPARRSAAPHRGPQEGQGRLVRSGEHFHPHAGDRPDGVQGLLGVDDVAQGRRTEYVELLDVKVVQQGLVPRQHPAGHQDAAVGEHALLDISGQPAISFLFISSLKRRPSQW